MEENIIKIDVGGILFKTKLETLAKYPRSRLGNIVSSGVQKQSENENVYFFDRNPVLFNWILDFYRTDELHLPLDICTGKIIQELEFWGIERGAITDCCIGRLIEYDDIVETREELRRSLEENEMDSTRGEIQNSRLNYITRTIWNTMDKPRSSKYALIYNGVFLLTTLLSLFVFLCYLGPFFRIHKRSIDEMKAIMNQTGAFDDVDWNNTKHVLELTSDIAPPIYYMDFACLVFFTLDIILRILVCPNKYKFCLSSLNSFNVVLVITMWVTFIMERTDVRYDSRATLWIYNIARALTILRLLLLLRFFRHHSGLKILSLTISASVRELSILLMTLIFAVTSFGCFIYYAESHERSTFLDIFEGFWWAIITMTSVGYGDVYPVSAPGKIVAAVCAVVGGLIFAMPTAIIVTNFSDYYQTNKIRERRVKEKERSEKVTTYRCNSSLLLL